MLLLTPVLVALAVALLRGGSLRHLGDVRARGVPFIALSLAIQVALYTPALQAAPVVLRWGGAIYVGAMGLALAGALCNWRLGVAARVVTLGLALNALAIAANGGYMPVDAAAMRSAQGEAMVRQIADSRLYGNTRLAGRSTRLTLLSDVLPVHLPGGPGNVYSVGDTLIAAGIATLVYRATRRGPAPA